MAGPPSTDVRRLRVHVSGIVQGVGFRPYVHALATRHRLAGTVANDEGGVVIEVEGERAVVDAFLAELPAHAPALAVIETLTAAAVPPLHQPGFTIGASAAAGSRTALISPDVATCAACLADVRDPADRRHGYVFTNCTDCGPRYTIVRDVPYDRAATTMAGFAMCADCRREYDDVTDRRFHAQPVCCPRCGPRLELVDRDGRRVPGDPVATTAAMLTSGAVVAVKGLGGYHLAADAHDETAIAALRARKHREDRPFAVMVADVAAARRLTLVEPAEETLLTSPARPIVLLRRRDDGGADRVADSVAPRQPTLGLMLPYTALHHLLLAAVGGPLVLTSGNVSDEPIAYDDGDAAGRLGGIADAFLRSDRPIQTRVDDSVVRVVRGRPVPVRRSRGYVPLPLPLPEACPRPVLACGPELKNTLCLARGRQAFVSHHIGDLENFETFQSFLEAITHLRRLLDITPAVVAHDLHPDYLSTKHALTIEGVDHVGVQHHHAHIASCLVDNEESGPVIGVAFDGLGMGEDGTLWGGEFLVAGLDAFTRVAHLGPVPMPGGAAAVRQPWRMAAAHLDAAYNGRIPAGLAVAERQGRRWSDVLALSRAGVNAPRTSSMGRLFDALSAIVGLRDEVSYEGQAAIDFEHCADPGERGRYPVVLPAAGALIVDAGWLVRAVVEDTVAGVAAATVAGRVHNTLADVVVEVCTRLRAAGAPTTVALSGGVFQNVRLLEGCLDGLTDAGFRVLTHRRVPPNDGGISLGQAAVAAARDRAGRV
ncbi:MAG: hydrogenase maturation protein HypF [Frankiaceae bacterium]|nr:hydrogenase maturation protein HypF [Frankiaceae bacterium]